MEPEEAGVRTEQDIDKAFHTEVPLNSLVRLVLKEGLLAESNIENTVRIRQTQYKIPLQDVEGRFMVYHADGKIGEEELEFSGTMEFIRIRDGATFNLKSKDISDYKIVDDGTEPIGLPRNP